MERGRQKRSEKKRVEQITLLPFNVRNYLNAKFHSSLSSPYIISGTVPEEQEHDSEAAPRVGPGGWKRAQQSEVHSEESVHQPLAIHIHESQLGMHYCTPPPLSHSLSVYCSLSCHDEVGRTFLTETEFIYKARVFSVRGLFNYSADGRGC